MKQRRLGKNGPLISPIGIGAMSFSNFYGETNESESHQLMTAALDQGVTHIDTANIYGGGVSETVIGTFLAKQGALRNDLMQLQNTLTLFRKRYEIDFVVALVFIVIIIIIKINYYYY